MKYYFNQKLLGNSTPFSRMALKKINFPANSTSKDFFIF